ncbi:hypothetical protein NDU88_001540 [Pleurodeles waltl]|uniref:Nuclease HARBI1 n=1 Tax=Pleurodeles waltl TaxID=8319 RepID=A0AAV7KYW0_PLEWA|nr:hypothetical protein NDU88_001540 [Pleurodeles waltl]
MAVTSAAVRTAAVRPTTAGALRHWLLKRIGFNVNQCGFAPRSSTAYRHGVPQQRIDLTSHCRTSQIIVACCMLHNLALRRQVPFLQEDGPDGGVVAAVEPAESEEEEDEEDDTDNRDTVIQQYFQ